jgi:glycosyltransferase involved in cell wall biosynthesis
MSLRLAVLVSHPIQHFAPWHREAARLKDIDLKVYFYCDWGVSSYLDPEFQTPVEWDVPLLDGYAHEFLPISKRPTRLNYLQVDNPAVGQALDSFNPDVVKVFGYAYRTNWRVAGWAKRWQKPLLLYSDSNARARPAWWKRLAKQAVVRRFYGYVDGALFVGDNNRAYHEMYGLPSQRLFPGALPVDRGKLLSAVPDREATRRDVRARHGIPPDAFVVLFSGKYIARKRPLDLVAAAHGAMQNGVPVWSLLVGEGPERARIEDYCRRENVRNAALTGFINQASIADYYVAADALAVTSSHDPHPLVVSEGASFGLPVVLSDAVGCLGASDTAREGVNAIIYTCGDRERLRRALEKLCRDGELYGRMSSASARISQEQDVTVAAKNLAEAAHKLYALGPRRRTRRA